MSLDEKVSRLNKLKKIQFPSLHETAEIESLQEEIKLELQDSSIIEPDKTLASFDLLEHGKEAQSETKNELKQKRTLIEFAIDKLREKKGLPPKQRKPGDDILSKIAKRIFHKEAPATWDEIQQLKLEVIRARLQKDKAISKAKIRELRNDRLSNILGFVGLGGNKTETTKKSKKKSRSSDSNKQDDIRDLVGKKTAKDYEGLI